MLRKTGSVKRGVVAPDLIEERQKIAFDQNELRNFFAGSAERAASWKETVDLIGADPIMRNHFAFYDMTPHEMQEDLWKRINVMFTKHHKRFFQDNAISPPYTDWPGYFQGLLPGVGLSVSMFRTSVENLANAEQRARWLPQIMNLDIIGCYAQTEIAHGSNVAGIETTATFDKATDEFVIHTPSITATKYWPGDLGRFSSHAVVFARLLIDENDYGVQPFMVQIRDTETWKIREGVQCGDLGPKIGYVSKDNGWASFNKVRIPRTDMFMGLAEVSREGEMSIVGDVRVLYSVMMGIRMLIVQSMGCATMNSAKIAIRYCSVRRQFSTQQGTKDERKVIDYQTTSFTLAKMLARGITMAVAGNWASQEYTLMMEDVLKNKVFTRMDPNHHILSGFKALFSGQALADIDEARRCCGGAGYQSNAGFTSLFSAISPIPTYEGENKVMLGQASRYLIKMIKKANERKKLVFPFTYLANMHHTIAAKNQARTIEDFLNLEVLDMALQVRACNLIESTMRDYNASDAPTKVKDNDLFYEAKIKMTVAHLKYLQLQLFRKASKDTQFSDSRISPILELLGKIFCLQELLEDGAAVYDTGFFAPGTYRQMQQALERCVAELRPQFVPLAETPYFPDHWVPSVIGNEYGDIYEQQLEMAQKSRLNINNEVPEYFDRLMKPLLRAKL